MSYSLEFRKQVLKALKKTSPDIQKQLLTKLKERLENPHVEGSKLRNMKDCYKIKLRASGYRLVYEVNDTAIVVTVIALGRRDGNIYDQARDALNN